MFERLRGLLIHCQLQIVAYTNAFVLPVVTEGVLWFVDAIISLSVSEIRMALLERSADVAATR